MALIKCIECGNDISDMAVICPKCGIELKTKPNIVNKKNNNSINKLLNIFSAIFISLYSIYCIYTSYLNITNFIEYLDGITLVSFCSYLCNITYYLGSALLLWMLFIYNINKNKIFKLLGGITLAGMILFALIYYLVGLFTWTNNIEYFFELLGNILQVFFGSYGIPISLFLLFINKK